MSQDSIQIKLKDRNDGAGSTFNGYVLSVSSSITIKELTSVRVKKTRKDADNPNSPSRVLKPHHYLFNGRSIELLIGRQEFIAIDFIREASEAEFKAEATPEMIRFRKVMLAGIGADLKGIAESEKMKNVIANSSSFNSAGEVKNGMKSMMEGAKPTLDFSNRVRVVQLQPGAADGSADKVDASVSELTDLFKKTNMTGSGNLNKAVFSFGSTSSIFNVLKKHTTLSNNKIKSETEKVLPSTITPKVLTIAKEAISDKSLGKTPANNINQGVKAEVKAKAPDIDFGGFGFDQAGIIPGASRSGANAFARSIAKLKGIVGNIVGDVTEKISGVPEGVVVPEDKNIPNIIEGLNEQTGKISLDTNVGKFIPKGSLTTNLKPVSTTVVSSSPTTFKGTTSKGHEFQFVDTVDELIDELVACPRVNTIGEKAISVLVVGFLGDELYGGPDKMNAKAVHDGSIEDDKQFFIQEGIDAGLTTEVATARAQQLLEDSADSDNYGAQTHYLILTDGRIQRVRPLSRARREGRDPYHLNGLELMFVAGGKNPANAEQLRTFEEFLMRVYKVLPGINVFGDNEIDPELLGPGFDVGAYRDKFDKDFQIIKDPSDEENVTLNRKALSIIQPPKGSIAKSTITQLQTKVNNTNPTNITKSFETKDPKTGEQIKVDIDAELKNIDDAIRQVNINQKDIANNIEIAATKSFAAAEKGFADLNINTKTVTKDINVGKIDSFIKSAATKSLDMAKKIASRF